jgi:hypothetical protein
MYFDYLHCLRMGICYLRSPYFEMYRLKQSEISFLITIFLPRNCFQGTHPFYIVVH